jgi:hypothetical protein
MVPDRPRQAVTGGGGENWAASGRGELGHGTDKWMWAGAGEKSAHAQVCYSFSLFSSVLFALLFQI